MEFEQVLSFEDEREGAKSSESAYRTPELAEYGSLDELTKGFGNAGDDGPNYSSFTF